MARQVKAAENKSEDESLIRIFFRGFFWPVRMLGKGLAWLGHRPPLKQIGHGLRAFFTTKPLRFLGRILGFNYIRGSWKELQEVTWPTKREGLRLTGAVIVFSVVFGALIAAVDYGLDKLFREVLLK